MKTDTPAEDALNFGLEPSAALRSRATCGKSARAQVDGVDSAGIRAEGMHWRPPNAAKEAGPARPQGSWCPSPTPLPRLRPSWAGRARCRRTVGRTESERGGNPLPLELCAPPAAGRAAPRSGLRAASGTCAVAADSRAPAQLTAPLEAGSRERGRAGRVGTAPASPGTPAPGFALAQQGGQAVPGEQVSAQAGRRAGWGSPASKPLCWSVFLTLFSQSFIIQPHQSRVCSLALLLLLLLLYRALLSRQVCRHGCRSFAYIILVSSTAVGSHKR